MMMAPVVELDVMTQSDAVVPVQVPSAVRFNV